MKKLKIIPGRFNKKENPTVLCSTSYWIFTDRGGFLETLHTVATRVEKDATIARIRNIFGDIIKEYTAPESGIIIGRSIDPIAQTGARIIHLGVES